MAKRIDSKLEDKIVTLFALDMKPYDIKAKIIKDGIDDGTNSRCAISTIYRVLQTNGLIDPPKKRGQPTEDLEPVLVDCPECFKVHAIADGCAEHFSTQDMPPDKSASLTTSTDTFSNIYQELAHKRRVALDQRKQAVEVFPLARIMDVNEFIAEANVMLEPLEEEHRINGELLGSLRGHLDGLALLAHALSAKDSELTKLQREQEQSKSAISGLNQKVAKWQAHAFRRATGQAGEDSLVDRN